MNADRQVLTATLDKGQQLGTLASGANGCYNGTLTVSEASNSRLTMRFNPRNPQACNTWTVIFTPTTAGALSMAVNPDNNRYQEAEFVIRMTHQS